MNGVAGTVIQLVPIAVLVVAGWWLAHRKIIAAEVSKPLCDLTFLLLIPAFLFPELYASDLRQLFDIQAIATYAGVSLTGMVIVGGLCRRFTNVGAAGTALRMMAACQINTAYFAIPVFVQLFDDAAPVLPVLVLQVCCQTVLVLIILELAENHRTAGRHPAVSVARSVTAALTTPVVIACAAAIACNIMSLTVPETVLSGLSFAGEAASPVALIALGLHLGGSTLRLRGATPDENAIIVVKCVIFPLMVFGLAEYVLPISDPWPAYLTMLAAMPTPQNVFVLAGRYGGDLDFAGSVVVKTTFVALLLLPVWTTIVM
ncbi:AEC family transporter [Nocardia flavorosea]|uniref:AEC family transporter n=1 Tax=Nocardia flavorosea TaxID=53429 RepID=A0A846YBT0_9NOCA|nr:AEC family transporter [Nocardia flavorosea]NKY55231.1 AEC family transporter [Nocardia flavorosea]